jgi:AbrB family looped-hinge helix DNA binding protein
MIGPMAAKEKLTTTVSSKGQVILPSALRQRREWRAGTRLTVEETEDGVLLKPAPAFAETRPEDVFGALPYRGKPKTIAEMDVGVLAEAKRRHDRD